MKTPSDCPAIGFIDPALAEYSAGPDHDVVAVGDTAHLQVSIGPLCVDKAAMAGEVALDLAAAADECQGVCAGNEGCAVLERAATLLIRSRLGIVPPVRDYA